MKKVVAPTKDNQAMMHSVFDFIAEVSIVDCWVCPVGSLCGIGLVGTCTELVERYMNYNKSHKRAAILRKTSGIPFPLAVCLTYPATQQLWTDRE